jgi:transcription elongation factor S-II
MVRERVRTMRSKGDRNKRLGRAARSLMENLHHNRGLLLRVLQGKTSVDLALSMPLNDMMCEDQRRALTEQQRRVVVHKRGSDGAAQGHDEGSTTDIFRCPACRARRTTYYQMQTRSSDEPMTTFITCVATLPDGSDCGHKWSI